MWYTYCLEVPSIVHLAFFLGNILLALRDYVVELDPYQVIDKCLRSEQLRLSSMPCEAPVWWIREPLAAFLVNSHPFLQASIVWRTILLHPHSAMAYPKRRNLSA